MPRNGHEVFTKIDDLAANRVHEIVHFDTCLTLSYVKLS